MKTREPNSSEVEAQRAANPTTLDLLEKNTNLLLAIGKIHQIASRELAEPSDPKDTGSLVEICTIAEEWFEPGAAMSGQAKPKWTATRYECEIGYVSYRPSEGDWFAGLHTKCRGLGSFPTTAEAKAAVEKAAR